MIDVDASNICMGNLHIIKNHGFFQVDMCGVEYRGVQFINLMGYPHAHKVGVMPLICIRGLV
jgi:hypothetical protein